MWLIPSINLPRAAITLIPLLFLLLLNACDGDGEAPQPQVPAAGLVTTPPPVTVDGEQATAAPEETTVTPLPPAGTETPEEKAINPEFSVGNSQYVLDVAEHSREELLAMLERADELATVATEQFDGLEIALVLHGPDIEWFAKKNYEEHKKLVDLAAKLDALEVIDLKVCQQSIQKYGYLEDDIPAFIDRVPYAPDELRRLEGSGYFQL